MSTDARHPLEGTKLGVTVNDFRVDPSRFQTAMEILQNAGLDPSTILRDGTSKMGYETSEKHGKIVRFDSRGVLVREFHPWPANFPYSEFRAALDNVVVEA